MAHGSADGNALVGMELEHATEKINSLGARLGELGNEVNWWPGGLLAEVLLGSRGADSAKVLLGGCADKIDNFVQLVNTILSGAHGL